MLKKIITPQHIIGLEVTLQEDDQHSYTMVQLHQKGTKISIAKTTNKILSFDTLLSQLDLHTPIIIALSGKKIVHKYMEQLPDDPTTVLPQVFPNADHQSLCYQLYPLEKGAWVSIMRKAILEDIISKFQEAKLPIIQVNLGHFSYQLSLPLLNNGQQVQHLQEAQFNLTMPQYWAAIPPDTTSCTIGDESLATTHLLAFSVAFQYLLQEHYPVYNTDNCTALETTFLYKTITRKVGIGALATILVLLVFNFISFNWLNQTIQQQNGQLAYHSQQLEQLDTLKNNYLQQQQFFKHTTILKASTLSLYADKVAASIPAGIQLESLTLFPIKEAKNTNNILDFEQHKVLIKGTSSRSSLLNNWLRTLNAFKWVKHLHILPYKENRQGIGTFELALEIIE